MEDGLWLLKLSVFFSLMQLVLILVLMEDGLWPTSATAIIPQQEVLILVLMEDGLWPAAVAAYNDAAAAS